ncbi:hypothetical protein NE865_06361 [Phthorimaea operculella]|nr:hypothetical protein NE865_06361 [Phthorimaea operculella]
MACRLANKVEKELGKSIGRTVLWSDSKTVLAWIANDCRDYPKFVAHRLAEIDQCVSRGSWRWVPSESNPADEATKLAWPGGRSSWVSGPSFLCCSQEQWPGAEPEGVQSVEEADGGETAHINVVAEQAPPLIDATRHSTWARVLAFTRVCRGGRTAAITAEDLRDAELRLLMQAQTASFAEELGALRAGRALPANSSLHALDPIIYEDGLLRVRGRLSAAPNLSIDERHPIILDGREHLVRLLVYAYHLRALHANHEAKRQKWTVDNPTVREGDMVVICDGNLPRNMWPKGIIKKVYPGADGRVRVVDVRTAIGVLLRPVVKVIVLPPNLLQR